MDYPRKSHRVARRQEARHRGAYDDIFSLDDPCDGDADARVCGDGARRRAPRREVVGQIEFDGGLAVRARDERGLPEGRVLENFSDERVNEIVVVLEVGELARALRRGEVDGLRPGVAGEVVVDREGCLHGVVSLAVELASYVADGFGRDAVDGFVNDAERDFGSGGGRAVRASTV